MTDISKVIMESVEELVEVRVKERYEELHNQISNLSADNLGLKRINKALLTRAEFAEAANETLETKTRDLRDLTNTLEDEVCELQESMQCAVSCMRDIGNSISELQRELKEDE